MLLVFQVIMLILSTLRTATLGTEQFSVGRADLATLLAKQYLCREIWIKGLGFLKIILQHWHVSLWTVNCPDYYYIDILKQQRFFPCRFPNPLLMSYDEYLHLWHFHKSTSSAGLPPHPNVWVWPAAPDYFPINLDLTQSTTSSVRSSTLPKGNN